MSTGLLDVIGLKQSTLYVIFQIEFSALVVKFDPF
jgi:hypothetical protein